MRSAIPALLEVLTSTDVSHLDAMGTQKYRQIHHKNADYILSQINHPTLFQQVNQGFNKRLQGTLSGVNTPLQLDIIASIPAPSGPSSQPFAAA